MRSLQPGDRDGARWRAAVFTVPKLRPVLPQTVTPVHRDGARGALPVVWNLPPDSRWPGVMVIVTLGMFLAAAVIGPIVRAHTDDVPPEPPADAQAQGGHH